MNSIIQTFSKGIHNVLNDEIIPSDASSGSINWITKDGRIILAGGRQLTGSAGLVGRINGLWTGYKTNGDKVIYRKTAEAIQALIGTTWTDVVTGLTNTDISFSNYSSLAGAFTFINGPDGYWVINNANPTSVIDIYSSTKNFKGYILIDRGRTLLFNREGDKTGLYGSWIDRQDSTVYTAVNGESIGSSGSWYYEGTLAFKAGGAARNSFALTITDGTQTGRDDFNGNIIMNNVKVGSINYATGKYDILFPVQTTGAIVANYQWQDFTNKGIADFTKSATRLAGEGFQFPQDEGGDAIMNVLIGQDGAYYSMKKHSAYRLEIDSTDVNATNILYRKDIGVPSFRSSVSTSKGIVFINDANPVEPILTILKKNQLGDSIEPYTLIPHFKFSDYKYDDCSMDTYDQYIMIACKTANADENDTILMVNLADSTVDIIKYEARVFTKDGIKLYVGSPISQDVYEILVGFDDEGLAITNEWKSKGENYNSILLKKFKRLRFKGVIDADQKVEIYESGDDSGYALVGTIDGGADYVDYTNPQTIGSNFIGGSQIGGDGSASAYPYMCELRVKVSKFKKRNLKFVATGIGYVDIEMCADWNILVFEDRISKKYRVKRT